ncbi:uncharacterized protein SPSK_08798 [Sporothrix schenckii 1099-18]|uniref:Uncharacterized protein n=1 Tax=Sporothrix schenckii 1099-18 TaxID=1397361 RepID=A0A0F2MB19_SPOSC|nr:uncharacterized protein SPSK_08798 [Sporothrix schenckii 1099-18]KJR85366.1 hypothetical protein SPSK_08798 [Sporothrix schenckii 1099-18]
MDDEPSEAAVADGGKQTAAVNNAVKATTGSNGTGSSIDGIVTISPRGDVVLDVLFETSRETLRATRKKANRMFTPATATTDVTSALKPKLPMAFRVESSALKKNSRYFANLLGDTRFKEARTVEAGLAALALADVKPADADVTRLPRVHIDDDDEGSRTAGRELVFAELLRILHWDGTVAPVAVNMNSDNGDQADKAASPQSNSKLKAKSNGASRTAAAAPKGRPAKTNPLSGRTVPSRKGANSDTATQNNSSVRQTHPVLLPGTRWSAKTPPTLLELATLALQADRFACTDAAAAYVRALRLRFPQPIVRSTRSDGGLGVGSGSGGGGLPGMTNEEAIRQKIFMAWLLDQPLRFHAGTRELILYGSARWTAAMSGEEEDDSAELANGNGNGRDTSHRGQELPAWWDLPDGLESELQFRRACIVNCIASVPRHFLALYTSRNRRQCKMGYESSAACDSFQLGEIVKFLFHKDLLFLQDFSSTVMSKGRTQQPCLSPADYAAVDVHHILSTLKQCPAYQLDKHHVNCGLRTRILPILEYIQTMLAASAVGLHRHDWMAVRHGKASWLAAAEAAGLLDGDGCAEDGDDSDIDGDGTDGNDDRTPSFGKPASGSAVTAKTDQYTPQVFRFTRSLAGDQRLRYEGSIAADRMARQLFTARRWNWTPEN